jgi:hypothetical protein
MAASITPRLLTMSSHIGDKSTSIITTPTWPAPLVTGWYRRIRGNQNCRPCRLAASSAAASIPGSGASTPEAGHGMASALMVLMVLMLVAAVMREPLAPV